MQQHTVLSKAEAGKKDCTWPGALSSGFKGIATKAHEVERNKVSCMTHSLSTELDIVSEGSIVRKLALLALRATSLARFSFTTVQARLRLQRHGPS